MAIKPTGASLIFNFEAEEEDDWLDFRRIAPDNWEQRFGESWEPVNSGAEVARLELAFESCDANELEDAVQELINGWVESNLDQ